jgi:hypothetical protein
MLSDVPSPALFNVMLSDVPSSPDVVVIGYADNLTLFTSAENPKTAQWNMQSYLDRFEAWCRHWHFLLNPDKCGYQLFSNRQILPQISLCICTWPVAFTQHQWVLGVTFGSPCLNFAAHIQSV